MNTGEKQQSSQCANGLHYLKPHWKIIRDGFPLSVFDFLELIPVTAILMLSGHDSLDSLAIITLFLATDYTFIDIVHNAAGQAFQGPIAMFVGALDWLRVRDMFQRALVSAALILLCLSIPAVLASYWVFLLCGQSTYIAATATVCIAIGIPDELACIIYTLINKTLIANHKVWPVVVSGVVVAVTATGMECFAYWMGTGPVGMVLAYTLADFATALFMVLITFALKSIRELELFHWSRTAFSNLWEMIALFLKSILYEFSTRVPRQLGTIMIGLLGESALAAQSILLRFSLFPLTCAFGYWSKAVAVMGRAAGAKKRDKFFSMFAATLTMFVIFAFFAFTVLFALRYPIAYLTTSIASVQTIIIKMMPLVAVYAAMVIMWLGSNSIAYSVGRINAPTFVIVFSSFCIGIPISMLLTFLTSLGLYGFYIGLIATYAVALAILCIYYACKWNDLIRPEFDSASESTPLVTNSGPFPGDGGDLNPTRTILKSENDLQTGSVSDLSVLHASESVGPKWPTEDIRYAAETILEK